MKKLRWVGHKAIEVGWYYGLRDASADLRYRRYRPRSPFRAHNYAIRLAVRRRSSNVDRRDVSLVRTCHYQWPRLGTTTSGTGQVDFPAVMTPLKKGGFTSGPLVIECPSPGDLKALLAEARNFVEQLVRGWPGANRLRQSPFTQPFPEGETD
jgi:hypothetical protein